MPTPSVRGYYQSADWQHEPTDVAGSWTTAPVSGDTLWVMVHEPGESAGASDSTPTGWTLAKGVTIAGSSLRVMTRTADGSGLDTPSLTAWGTGKTAAGIATVGASTDANSSSWAAAEINTYVSVDIPSPGTLSVSDALHVHYQSMSDGYTSGDPAWLQATPSGFTIRRDVGAYAEPYGPHSQQARLETKTLSTATPGPVDLGFLPFAAYYGNTTHISTSIYLNGSGAPPAAAAKGWWITKP